MLSTVKGTLPYMAPELVAHEPGSTVQIDHQACDMWSLGEMAHRMLMARAAFPSQAALFRYMIRPESSPFQELADCASRDAESLIHALMRPTPEHRLTSANALHHAWIRPCRPLGVNLAPSRTSTPMYATSFFF